MSTKKSTMMDDDIPDSYPPEFAEIMGVSPISAPCKNQTQDSLKLQIKKYALLRVNFDGYQGHAPSADDLFNACQFIDLIPKSIIADVMTFAEGGGAESGGHTLFKWGGIKNILEVGFADGDIYFCGEFPSGEEVHGQVKFNEKELPAKLIKLIEFLSKEDHVQHCR